MLRRRPQDLTLCLPLPAADPVRKPPQKFLLYYITDRLQFPGTARAQIERLLEKITECASAGIDLIQLREKDLTTRELEALATRAVAAIPAGSFSRLLISSRIDVAIACGAHGVHLPANSLSPSEARSIFARVGISAPVIAISTHADSEVKSAESHGADFAVFGPIFGKAGVASPSGLAHLAAVSGRVQTSSSPLPVLALGGVTLEKAPACLEAGAAGVAGIRLFQDGNAHHTIRRLRALANAGAAARG